MFGGLMGPPPPDVLAILVVVFATFSLDVLSGGGLGLLRLTPLVWMRGFLWQLASYPFVGFGAPSLWLLLELLLVYWFGRDVFRRLGRRSFWAMLAYAVLGGAAVAVAVHLVGYLLLGGGPLAAFVLMQGQRMLLAVLVAAFASLYGQATIYLFFVLPIKARWFLWLEVLFAFLGYLGTRDLPGFAGICAAVAITWAVLRPGGLRRGLREARLRLERRWLQRKLERHRKKSGLRVIPGGGRGPRDPSVH